MPFQLPTLHYFAHAAPVLWNSLPNSVKKHTTLMPFRRALKTHLFPQKPPFSHTALKPHLYKPRWITLLCMFVFLDYEPWMDQNLSLSCSEFHLQWLLIVDWFLSGGRYWCGCYSCETGVKLLLLLLLLFIIKCVMPVTIINTTYTWRKLFFFLNQHATALYLIFSSAYNLRN